MTCNSTIAHTAALQRPVAVTLAALSRWTRVFKETRYARACTEQGFHMTNRATRLARRAATNLIKRVRDGERAPFATASASPGAAAAVVSEESRRRPRPPLQPFELHSPRPSEGSRHKKCHPTLTSAASQRARAHPGTGARARANTHPHSRPDLAASGPGHG